MKLDSMLMRPVCVVRVVVVGVGGCCGSSSGQVAALRVCFEWKGLVSGRGVLGVVGKLRSGGVLRLAVLRVCGKLPC